MARMGGCSKATIIGLSVIGSVGLLVGGLVYAVFPTIFNNKVQESLVLKEGGDSIERFQTPPVESLLKITCFHVVNNREVNKNGVKPILKEMGPYVFRQIKTKQITGWSPEKDYVYYKEKTQYIFDQEMSNGSLRDKIYHINAPDVGIATYVIENNLTQLINVFPNNLVVQHTVSELLFEGYSVTLLVLAAHVGIKVPEILPNNKFGVFYMKNNTYGQEFIVNTGLLNMAQFSEILMFDGYRTLPYWEENSHCNDINGTDGTQYAPGVTDTDTLYVFSTDLCRSLPIKYTENVKVEGIDALRFQLPESAFADPNLSYENKCYCAKGRDCPKAGVIPLEHSCRPNQPIAMSAPHFYMADEQYQKAFDGIQSDKELHGTYIDIEPLTGTVISGRKRIQVNIATFQHDVIRPLKKAKKGYFPLIWIEEGADIDEKTAEQFISTVIKPKKTAEWALIAVISGGGALTLIAFSVYLVKRKQ